MRDAVAAAEKDHRFGSIEFDEISLRSENHHTEGPDRLAGAVGRSYERPSQVIRKVLSQLSFSRDSRSTAEAFKTIDDSR